MAQLYKGAVFIWIYYQGMWLADIQKTAPIISAMHLSADLYQLILYLHHCRWLFSYNSTSKCCCPPHNRTVTQACIVIWVYIFFILMWTWIFNHHRQICTSYQVLWSPCRAALRACANPKTAGCSVCHAERNPGCTRLYPPPASSGNATDASPPLWPKQKRQRPNIWLIFLWVRIIHWIQTITSVYFQCQVRVTHQKDGQMCLYIYIHIILLTFAANSFFALLYSSTALCNKDMRASSLCQMCTQTVN